MATGTEISRTSLHDQVVSRLRSMLIEGQVSPGGKLKERELCEVLGVSRTPLREAMKLLASEGLVNLVPNRGAFAARLDENDMQSTFEVLAALEGLAGELAAQRISDSELDEIRALHFEMKASYARRNISGYYKLNAAVHDAINRAAKNPVLSAMYRNINARVQPMRFRTNLDETKWARAVAEHEKMIDALSARDPAALRQMMSAHLNSSEYPAIDRIRASGYYSDTSSA